MSTTRIRISLTINPGVLLASITRLIFGGVVIALGLTDWEEFVHCQMRDNDSYSGAESGRASFLSETGMFL